MELLAAAEIEDWESIAPYKARAYLDELSPYDSSYGETTTERDQRSGQRSISPNTISSEPMIAATSAIMCPRDRKSIACRWAKEGARILHR